MPSSSSSIKWERTNLRLPVQASDYGAFSSHSERAASTCAEASANAHLESNDCYLCLPSCIDSKGADERSKDYADDDQLSKTQRWHNRMALDRYLSSVPQLAASTQQLLSSNPNNTHPSDNHHKLITSTNSGRVINVLQGEIAHCTAAQADVLVSDDATTCHILGLWSRLLFCGDVAACALATLAHIDSPEYQDCITNAIDLHYQYHASMLSSNNNDNTTLPFIELSIHLMGGYNDEKGTSHAITEALLRTLSHECDKYVNMKPGLQMIVQTCAVSSCNDDGSGCPIGRGLALDVSSGQVYLAEVEEEEEEEEEEDVECSSSSLQNSSAAASFANDTAITTTSAKGPDCLLRSARLWASCLFNDRKRRLQIIHHINDDYLYIPPFFFASHPFLYQMLALNDDVLLQQCSSSPRVEKDNFARHVRETFRYMIGTNCFHVFEEKASEREYWDDGDYLPRRYCRVGLNGWTVVR